MRRGVHDDGHDETRSRPMFDLPSKQTFASRHTRITPSRRERSRACTRVYFPDSRVYARSRQLTPGKSDYKRMHGPASRLPHPRACERASECATVFPMLLPNPHFVFNFPRSRRKFRVYQLRLIHRLVGHQDPRLGQFYAIISRRSPSHTHPLIHIYLLIWSTSDARGRGKCNFYGDIDPDEVYAYPFDV